MTIRKIAQIGHPVLRQRANEVPKELLQQPSFQAFIDDLIETMRDASGAGLAANQVYEPVRVCAIEVLNNPRYPYKPHIPLTVFVNPEVELLTDETFPNYEGCLSVPNLRGLVDRITRLRVRAWDRNGDPCEEVFEGFGAATVQHEFDHLDGKLFVDHVKDPTTLATWTEFERHHLESWLKTADKVKRRFHV